MRARKLRLGGLLALGLAGTIALLRLSLSADGHAPARLPPERAAAPPVTWEYRGFNLPVWGEQELFRSGPALRQLAATGANTVTFVVTWYVTDPTASTIHRTEKTATDDSLVWAMREARSLGLRVMLKPHIDSEDEHWRVAIDPPDPDRWFREYGAMLDRYADLAREEGAVALCVGTELIALSTNPAHEGRWRALIAELRARFGGMLTYSANWGDAATGEFVRIPFWDALDYLGLSAYFELAATDAPTVAALTARWAEWRAIAIAPFQRRWGKPVLFVEVGCRSMVGAARQPWNAADRRPPAPQGQADCAEALFRAWSDTPWFAGATFWSWSPTTTFDPDHTGYEIQGKPAERTVITWFGGSAPPRSRP